MELSGDRIVEWGCLRLCGGEWRCMKMCGDGEMVWR